MFIKKIVNKLREVYLYFYLFINKRILFTDNYGLSYYLYKNTRPVDTFRTGVRTDDTTVLVTVRKIIECNLHLKNIHCIDVGAFIGVVTLMMARTLKKSSNSWNVHSFEPSKTTFIRLTDNVNMIEQCQNIELNNTGLSDRAGIQKMLIKKDSPGRNHLVSDFSESREDMDEVKISTLDEYLNKNSVEQILLCKIDAEGVDDLVLKGMKSYMDRGRVDYLILEYEDQLSQKKISNILKMYKYKVYYMVRNKNYLIENIEDYPENEQSLINILAVSPYANISPVKELLKT